MLFCYSEEKRVISKNALKELELKFVSKFLDALPSGKNLGGVHVLTFTTYFPKIVSQLVIFVL
jgi:hypothetical protein